MLGSWECQQVSSLWYFACCTNSAHVHQTNGSARDPAACTTPSDPQRITSHDASLARAARDDILTISTVLPSHKQSPFSANTNLKLKITTYQNILLECAKIHWRICWFSFSLARYRVMPHSELKLHLRKRLFWKQSGKRK